jgi:hypothetical protein
VSLAERHFEHAPRLGQHQPELVEFDYGAEQL